MANKVFANYEILKKLGEGGMGAVYLARDLNLEREVAIKIIAPELSRHDRLVSRFRVEAIAQAKLNHTNIVTIHSFSQEKNIYYIVMEYVDGKSLNILLKEQLPILQSLKIFSQILDGVAYAHSQGVVHRDIKPANVFLTSKQIAKIGDFGIAKIEGIEGITRVGSAIGSPVYSSPEQLMGETIDKRTDIYSLGITLYEMLTFKTYLKISEDTDYTAIKKALEYNPPKPSTRNPDIPAKLDAIVMKCIAKKPDHRFQDVNEIDLAVKQIISSLERTPEIPASDQPTIESPIAISIPKTLMFNKTQILIGSVFIAIIFITLIILIVSDGSDPSFKTTNVKGDLKQVKSTIRKTNSKKLPNIKSRNLNVEEPTNDSLITDADPLSETIIEMNWHIKRGNYQVAINLGKETIRNGTVSGDIYLVIAQSYYCFGKKKQSRINYMKALGYNNYLKFKVAYQYTKDLTIDGTLSISRKEINFTSLDEGLSSYKFTITTDIIGKISRRFIDNSNSKTSKLIISDKEKNKYTLLVNDSYKKSGKFIKDIINILKKM